MTGRAILRGGREALLTGGAVLGALCILATVAGYAFGITPLVFRSGSMSPAIHTGDLAVARTVDAASLETGDIVSVLDAEGQRVTHRLIKISGKGDSRQLTLQGDDNPVPDAEVYTVTRAERVLFGVPKAGYVVDAAAGPRGLFVLGAFVTGMLILASRRPPSDGGESPPARGRGGARKAERRAGIVRRSVALSTVGALVLVASPAVAAPWTNPVPVTGTTFTAYTLPAPATFSCGGLGVLSVSFTWAAVPGATSYTLHYGSGGATTKTVTGTSTSITSAISGGTAWIVANRAFGSTTWSSAASNTRSYTVAVVSLCS